MKIAVLGAAGMLGHRIYAELASHFPTWALVRQDFEAYQDLGLFDLKNFIGGCDAEDRFSLERHLDQLRPTHIVNCVGLTTRKIDPRQNHRVVLVNAWLPHNLQSWCARNGAHLIHFSTDCVFSGSKGNYRESDFPDAQDLYGISKHLGEVSGNRALTLRGSIIGREIRHQTELVEWFLTQRGLTAKGYINVRYSGVTTNYMASLVRHILDQRPNLEGLYHVSAPPLSKFDLLSQINRELDLRVKLIPESSYRSDKTLNSDRLYNEFPELVRPDWREMIPELKHTYFVAK